MLARVVPGPHGVGDRLDLAHLVLEGVEGGAVEGIQGEGGEEAPARLDVGAALQRGPALVDPLAHALLDAGLELGLALPREPRRPC